MCHVRRSRDARRAGVKDVFLAYNLVGPNISTRRAFPAAYPDVVRLTADHPGPRRPGHALHIARLTMDVLLDIDTGHTPHGLVAGPEALRVCIAISRILRASALAGFTSTTARTTNGDRAERGGGHADWERWLRTCEQLAAAGLPVPRIVAGGTGSFPLYAAIATRA